MGAAIDPFASNEENWKQFRDSPHRVDGLPPMLGVTTSTAHTCAWNAPGAVYCWGSNQTGQLGLGDEAPYHPRPTKLVELDAPTSVDNESSDR